MFNFRIVLSAVNHCFVYGVICDPGVNNDYTIYMN